MLCLVLVTAARAETARAETRVSIELVLAVDVSLSVNDPEYALQMQGIAAAFRDPEVGALIAAHEHGVAVALTQWSATREADQPLPWTVLRDAEGAARYAQRIASAPRTELGSFTGLGHAIGFASQLIATNVYDGDEKKIDVSGDGRNNTGPEPRDMREAAQAAGITINGLAIVDNDPGLASYYAENVIAGPEAFVMMARDFDDFAEAFKRKLKRELSPRIARLEAPSPLLFPSPHRGEGGDPRRRRGEGEGLRATVGLKGHFPSPSHRFAMGPFLSREAGEE